MKNILYIVFIAVALTACGNSGNNSPQECKDFFETKNKLIYEVKTSQYISDAAGKQYEKKTNEFLSLFRKGMSRESDKEKVKKTCKGLNDFWSGRLESLKQARSEKEFNSLL